MVPVRAGGTGLGHDLPETCRGDGGAVQHGRRIRFNGHVHSATVSRTGNGFSTNGDSIQSFEV